MNEVKVKEYKQIRLNYKQRDKKFVYIYMMKSRSLNKNTNIWSQGIKVQTNGIKVQIIRSKIVIYGDLFNSFFFF